MAGRDDTQSKRSSTTTDTPPTRRRGRRVKHPGVRHNELPVRLADLSGVRGGDG
jgi:hypothetical protein